MNFDTTTFILEILNFLVLMWLLKRFFYKPVQAAIAARQKAVQQIQEDARTDRASAEALRQEYQQHLQSWETEKQERMQALEQSLTDERERQMARIRAAAADEKARQEALCEKEHEALRQELQLQARQDALSFATRLLQRLQSPALDAQLLRLLEEDLQRMPPEQRVTLHSAAEAIRGHVVIQSATPLEDTARQHLEALLQQLLGTPILLRNDVDSNLISGVRLVIGPQRLHLNLQDELQYFRDHVLNGSF